MRRECRAPKASYAHSHITVAGQLVDPLSNIYFLRRRVFLTSVKTQTPRSPWARHAHLMCGRARAQTAGNRYFSDVRRIVSSIRRRSGFVRARRYILMDSRQRCKNAKRASEMRMRRTYNSLKIELTGKRAHRRNLDYTN